MAKVRMEEIVEKLNFQMQAAMKDALKEVQHAEISEKDLFRAFQKALRLRCGHWENVPDSAVDSGY